MISPLSIRGWLSLNGKSGLTMLQRMFNKRAKNTIGDADYFINWIIFILIIQYVNNFCHSYSIINKTFLSFIFSSLFSCKSVIP